MHAGWPVLLVALMIGAFRTPVQAQQAQWSMQNVTSQASRFNTVFFVSPTTGYVGGYRTLMMTTNGGDTWQAAKVPTSAGEIYAIHFPTPETGYAVDGSGQIFKSTDQGANWTMQTSGTTSRLTSVHFLDNDLGFAAGGDRGSAQKGVVLKTTDGGAHWTTLQNQTDVEYYCVWALDAQNVSVAGVSGNRGVVLRSTNGGSAWTSYETNAPTYPNGMQFVTADTGYMACGMGGILKTINGGITWTPSPTGYVKPYTAVYFVDGRTGYAVAGTDGLIMKTSDGGDSWGLEFSQSNLALASVHGAGSNVYAVGAGSMILRRRTLTSSVGESADEEISAGRVARLSVTPNPATEQCAITVELDRAATITLEVYSQLGQRVATLIDGEQHGAGTLRRSFQPASSGTYLVRLVRDGVVTTRMVTVSR